ncbi:MAG: hypothetical protein WBG26_08130, partial [Candidatus Binataceae bacterium]
YSHDAVAYVAEGGELEVVERADYGGRDSAQRTAMPAGSVAWYPRGAGRNFHNSGAGRFRQVLVELK